MDPKELHFTLRFSPEGRPSWNINALYTPTQFCSLIKQSREGLEKCLECDRRAFQEAIQTKKPLIYQCHAGLMDGVIPIMLGDNPVAFLMFGQFLTEAPSEEKFQEVWRSVKDLPVEYEELRNAFFNLPVFSLQYVESLAQGMFEVIQEIARGITHHLLPEEGREKLPETEIELWLAQQDWQILHIFKEERTLLSFFHWASRRAVLSYWSQLIDKELEDWKDEIWDVKSRLWGLISSLLSHLRIFHAASKINFLELSHQYSSMLMKCDTKEKIKETLEWIMNDMLAIRGETNYKASLVERAKMFIRENYAREDLSLKEVARAMRLSPYYLARLFKSSEGISIGRYIREVRIERARELLEITELPILEVALEVGYSDQAQFSKTFKKKTGLSPSKYRKARKILGKISQNKDK
ncbi:PocR ligand-binding domain-containing protein [bacterium]|nr:PocR ligand-binding domain-containing protein [bacterium]